MERATLTSKGQLTIPRRVRERLGLRPGDRILFDIDDDGIRLHVVKRHTVGELFEQLEGAAKDFPGHETERAVARRHLAERLIEE